MAVGGGGAPPPRRASAGGGLAAGGGDVADAGGTAAAAVAAALRAERERAAGEEPREEAAMSDESAADAKLRLLFAALDRHSHDGEERGLVERRDAVRALMLLLRLASEPDAEAMRKLCPQSWGSEQLVYEQFRDLVTVAGAWAALKSVDAVHSERRWAALSDPESHYTLDFPPKVSTSVILKGKDAEDEAAGPGSYRDRLARFRTEGEHLKKEVYRMIVNPPFFGKAPSDAGAGSRGAGMSSGSGLGSGLGSGPGPGPGRSDSDSDSDSDSADATDSSTHKNNRSGIATRVESHASGSMDSLARFATRQSRRTRAAEDSGTSQALLPHHPDGYVGAAVRHALQEEEQLADTARRHEAALAPAMHARGEPSSSSLPLPTLSRQQQRHDQQKLPERAERQEAGARAEQQQTTFSDLSALMKLWDVAKSLAAGGLAGVVAKTVIAPLDRTKIIFQTTERKFSLSEALRELRRIAGDEGLLGLWRGHSATLARVMPYAGIQFLSFDVYSHALLRDGDKQLTPMRRLVAGSMAGATSVVFTYPLDLLRARMSLQPPGSGGLRANLQTVYAAEGWPGLYRGLTPTLVGIVPYAGLAFGTFETLKIVVAQHHGTESVSAGQRFYCGVAAGFVAQSLTYPLDIVRRRMQTDGLHVRGRKAAGDVAAAPRPGGHIDGARQYTGVLQTLRAVASREGVIGGLYKGLTMNWIKGPIAHGISFTTFDVLKRMFDLKPRTRHGGGGK
jgi:solute carrier family 25 protein 42